MRIVVDAFGSDNCPGPDVAGAVLAAREWGDEIVLVGPEARVEAELAKHETNGLSLRVVHAPEVLTMEHHARDVRRMKEASIRVGMRLVKAGEADAFVSAGNTIAVLSSAIFDLRRIQGIRRPAIATLYPVAPEPVLLLDMGATVDVKPEYLLQFAQMGAVYAERVMGLDAPRIGLLANGEEPEKGPMALREAYHLLEESTLNFVGNVEPKEVTRGVADVVVTDGFTGNVMVKTTEAVAAFIPRLIKSAFSGPLTTVGGVLLLPAALLALPGLLFFAPGLQALRKRLDYAEYGGALLMGVDGVVIVAHGRSNARAIKNAVRQARNAVAGDVLATVKAGVLEAKEG
ncbi:MAG: phosphate acyltransferase PlsX [Anaerolineae bacterium]